LHDENQILEDYFAEKRVLLQLFDRVIPDHEILRAQADKLRAESNLFAPTNGRVSRGNVHRLFGAGATRRRS
jgi:hypothetical protein